MDKSDLFGISKMDGVGLLSPDEMAQYNGGESLWYWVAYGVGSIGRGITYVWNKNTEMLMEQRGHASIMPYK